MVSHPPLLPVCVEILGLDIWECAWRRRSTHALPASPSGTMKPVPSSSSDTAGAGTRAGVAALGRYQERGRGVAGGGDNGGGALPGPGVVFLEVEQEACMKLIS
jgi:hypothetical protein